MKKKIRDFESLKIVLKDKLEDFFSIRGVKKGTGKGMYNSIYTDTEDKHASLHVFKTKKNETMYYCHSSNRLGDIFIANNILTGAPLIGHEFITQNVKPLCEMFDIDYEFKPLSKEEIELMNMRNVYNMVRDIIVANLRLGNNIDKNVLEYIDNKKIDIKNDSKAYSIGYCNEWFELSGEMKKYGIEVKYLESIGIREYIFNPNNIIYTIKDERGRVSGFAARNCYYNKDNNSGAKYYNTINNMLYNKSNLLYNLDNAMRKKVTKYSSLYIVEGNQDAVTLDKHGLKAAALCSSKFTHDHISVLQQVGETDIVLLLDGDDPGVKSTANTIVKVMEGIRNFRVRIVTLPKEDDPDSFVRKYGKDKLLSLPHITAFEWRLFDAQQNSDLDSYEIAGKIVPLIVNESSPLSRDRMSKQVAEVCGLPLEVVRQEVQKLSDSDAIKEQQETEAIVDNLVKNLKHNTKDALLIMKRGVDTLSSMSDRRNRNIYGVNEFYNELQNIKIHQETAGDEDYVNLFRMPRFESKMRGSSGGKMYLLGGQPNAGKTIFTVNYCISALRAAEGDSYYGQRADSNRDNNITVFYHTIDDSRKELIPRFVSALMYEKYKYTNINAVGAPSVEDNIKSIPDMDKFMETRNWAYSVVEKWAKDGRLIIKDANIGATLSSGEMVLSSIRKKYPDRFIIYVIDNLHNLNDFANISDPNVRLKEIAGYFKQNIIVPYDIEGFATVEYRKGQGNTKSRSALNEMMRESKSLEYHANWVGHLLNEMHTDPDNTEMYFYDPAVPIEKQTPEDKCPIISLVVGKNKISGYKGELHYALLPNQGVSREITKKDIESFSPGIQEKLKSFYYRRDEEIPFSGDVEKEDAIGEENYSTAS